MKTSCINYISNDHISVVRQSFIDICDGDRVAAEVLNLLVYWHDIKLRQLSQSRTYNDTAEKHGCYRTQLEETYQWHTLQEIREQTATCACTKRISKAIKVLEKKFFVMVTKNPNPRFTFDNTKFFHVNPDEINAALLLLQEPEADIDDAPSEEESQRRGEQLRDGLESCRDGREDNPNIYRTKITSKTTPKITHDQERACAKTDREDAREIETTLNESELTTKHHNQQLENNDVESSAGVTLNHDNTVETQEVLQSEEQKKPAYALKQNDFAWLTEIYREYKPDNWTDTPPARTPMVVKGLKAAYEILDQDMESVQRHFKQALKLISSVPILCNYDVFWALNDARFVELGQRYENQTVKTPSKKMEQSYNEYQDIYDMISHSTNGIQEY